MAAINETCDQSRHRACSEGRCPVRANWNDLLPGTMEEIKNNNVNNRATGSKRERDEVTAVTPSSKRLCSVTPCCSLEQNPELHDEWDESLLDPSDTESVTSLSWTLAEIESLLEDDSSYAAEPSARHSENNACVVPLAPLESVGGGEQVGSSPCRQLDVSDTVTEEERDEDLSNYAAMAQSPSHSVICPVEVVELSKQNRFSVCTATSPDSVQDKTIMDAVSASTMSLSDLKETRACQLSSACSPKLPQHLSTALSEMDVVMDRSKDLELSFDGEIEDLLSVSSGDLTSSEEERGPELTISCTKQNRSAVSGSTTSLQHLNSVQVHLTVPAACLDTPGVVQHLSLSPLNTSDPLVVSLPSGTGPEPPKETQFPATSSMVRPEPQLITAAAGMGQDMRPNKSAEIEETKDKQEVGSTTSQTEPPINPSSALRSSNQIQIADCVGCKKPSSSAPAKEKSLRTVTTLPRPAFRQVIPHDLEKEKGKYCRQVSMHIDGPKGANNLEDPNYELTSLLNNVSRDYQNCPHPSNFSRRNHPRSGKKSSNRYSLNQWVIRNGGSNQRFQGLPSTFHRSPVPNSLPNDTGQM